MIGDLIDADIRVLEVLRTVGIPYDWGKGDPSTVWPPKTADCSGYAQSFLVRYGMLRSTEPDRNAYNLAMISDSVPGMPQFGDLHFYGQGRVSHVMVSLGGPWVIGASGGGSRTHADDPRAYVRLCKANYRNDLIVVGRIQADYRPH